MHKHNYFLGFNHMLDVVEGANYRWSLPWSVDSKDDRNHASSLWAPISEQASVCSVLLEEDSGAGITCLEIKVGVESLTSLRFCSHEIEQ